MKQKWKSLVRMVTTLGEIFNAEYDGLMVFFRGYEF